MSDLKHTLCYTLCSTRVWAGRKRLTRIHNLSFEFMENECLLMGEMKSSQVKRKSKSLLRTESGRVVKKTDVAS